MTLLVKSRLHLFAVVPSCASTIFGRTAPQHLSVSSLTTTILRRTLSDIAVVSKQHNNTIPISERHRLRICAQPVPNKGSLLSTNRASCTAVVYTVRRWKKTDNTNKPAQKPDSEQDEKLQESVVMKVVLDQAREKRVATTVAEKVQEGARDFTYILVALGAAGCLAYLVYLLAGEMLTPNSPQQIFSRAHKECCDSQEVVDIFGAPIKAFGEENRRGRRRRTAHLEYEKDGEKRMRMLFYLKGPMAQGSAHLEMKMVGIEHLFPVVGGQ